MTDNHPLVERYLRALDAALTDLAPTERTEVVAEIRQHIADATAAGKPIDVVLQSLGPVEALARAYQLELLVTPRATAPRQPRSDRWLKILGLIAIGSLPTFVIVVTLGTLGLSLSLSGLAVIIAGAADSVGALPSWVNMDVEPWVGIVLGVVITLVGVLCSIGTVAYVKFVVRLVRRILPHTNRTTA
jgi:uncharacterized membrane protein